MGRLPYLNDTDVFGRANAAALKEATFAGAITDSVLVTINALNGSLLSEQDIADLIVAALVSDHRTLQASYVRVLRAVLTGYVLACEQYGTDARNEGAADWCRTAYVAAQDTAIPFI